MRMYLVLLILPQLDRETSGTEICSSKMYDYELFCPCGGPVGAMSQYSNELTG